MARFQWKLCRDVDRRDFLGGMLVQTIHGKGTPPRLQVRSLIAQGESPAGEDPAAMIRKAAEQSVRPLIVSEYEAALAGNAAVIERKRFLGLLHAAQERLAQTKAAVTDAAERRRLAVLSGEPFVDNSDPEADIRRATETVAILEAELAANEPTVREFLKVVRREAKLKFSSAFEAELAEVLRTPIDPETASLLERLLWLDASRKQLNDANLRTILAPLQTALGFAPEAANNWLASAIAEPERVPA